MAEMKTRENDSSVDEFLAGVENLKRQEDARFVTKMMQRITGSPAKMWGDSIIGFDTYHYKYASGREGEWMMTGVSPRKASLTVYIIDGFSKYGELLGRLGKHKHSSSCLYIKKLEDVDLDVLEELITASIEYMRDTYQAAD